MKIMSIMKIMKRLEAIKLKNKNFLEVEDEESEENFVIIEDFSNLAIF